MATTQTLGQRIWLSWGRLRYTDPGDQYMCWRCHRVGMGGTMRTYTVREWVRWHRLKVIRFRCKNGCP